VWLVWNGLARIFHDHSLSHLHGLGSRVPVPGEGLYIEGVTAVAYDVKNGRTTGELKIWVYGNQVANDRMPVFGPW
jgi:hypothetical protein